VLVACLQRRKIRVKRRGWVALVTPFIGAAGGRGRRGGVRCGVRVEERDERREGGLALRSVAGTGLWPTDVGRRRIRICKLGFSLLSQFIGLLLLDHGIIQIFGLESQIISGNSIGGMGSLQHLG
jgi:hypothetical protein